MTTGTLEQQKEKSSVDPTPDEDYVAEDGCCFDHHPLLGLPKNLNHEPKQRLIIIPALRHHLQQQQQQHNSSNNNNNNNNKRRQQQPPVATPPAAAPATPPSSARQFSLPLSSASSVTTTATTTNTDLGQCDNGESSSESTRRHCPSLQQHRHLQSRYRVGEQQQEEPSHATGDRRPLEKPQQQQLHNSNNNNNNNSTSSSSVVDGRDGQLTSSASVLSLIPEFCSNVGGSLRKMASVGSLIYIGFSLLLTPFLVLLLAILFLASLGKSLGVRRFYIKCLLSLFEYGRQNIEKVKKRNGTWIVDSEDSGDEKEESSNEGKQNSNGSGKSDKKFQNGSIGNTVIARSKDLIMVPEPDMHKDETELNTSQGEQDSAHLSATKENDITRKKSFETLKKEFEIAIVLNYIRAGVEAIIEDEVTSRFEAEELKNWNLLTRTNRHYEFISWKLTFIWVFGFCVRYFFLLPLRILICVLGVMWLTFCTAIVGYVPDGPFKRWLNQRVSMMCFAVLSSALSSVINYHNPENRPRSGICVANHTSPIDVLVLMCDNCYSLIGQRHGGFLGILQRALARASPHIWFERSEVKDREAVTKRLKKHISDPTNPPILIFPEGTCINNTSVMQFKKGSFEVGGVIYPVAIKYDPRFGDAFWNSSRYSMLQYLYMMMSSWAIVCDVWYLPPMYRREDETAIDFANRVKSVIARQGGLVDLQWDGQLKRMKPKKEWKEKQQEEFSKRLKVE